MHELIETYMVLANEQVAKWCKRRKIPFLSRVHEEPPPENKKFLNDLLKEKGIFLKRDQNNNLLLSPKDLEDYLQKADSPEERYRSSKIILPKMSKACYQEGNSGHFGLALSDYTHFTSPIRRYPDLLTHRNIKLFLQGKMDDKKEKLQQKSLEYMGKSCSEKERNAENIEYAVKDIYAALLMKKEIGKIFSGRIS